MRQWSNYEVYKGKKLIASGHASEIAPVLGISSSKLSALMRCNNEGTVGRYRVVVTNRGVDNNYLKAIQNWDGMTSHYRKVFGIPRYKGGDPDGK